MFYLKLAWNNLNKSKVVVAPFLLASTVLFMLNNIVTIIMTSPLSRNMQNGKILLGLAAIILTIFATIMEIYSYNFLLKQRSREFGLYNILGMNKKQIGLVLSFELWIMYLAIVAIGCFASFIFSHLFYLVFVNLIHYNQLQLQVNGSAFAITSLIFALISVVLTLMGLVKIRKTSPLMLFRDQEQGEKEPRGNVILASLAIIAISIGYYISITSTKLAALAVLFRFFIAVLFVIVGTYLFYISFMTWYLKYKKNQKAYFYKPEHFVSTSQMIFRMKQNAVGLANITLLAVMAFIAIATTTALYSNIEYQTKMIFPKNTKISIIGKNEKELQKNFDQAFLKPLNRQAKEFTRYTSAMITLPLGSGTEMTVTEADLKNPNYGNLSYSYLITADDFKALGNKGPDLAQGQILFYKQKGDSRFQKITLLGQSFDVKENLKSVSHPEAVNTYNPSVIVVKDQLVLDRILKLYNQFPKYPVEPSYVVMGDLSKKEISKVLDKKGVLSFKGQYVGHLEERTQFKKEFYAIFGSFLFTGFILGLSFILGAALIIYYKQFTEGHLDQKAYKILQEVGMSTKQVKQTINSQLFLVFFTPIAFAVLHFAVALVMLKQMLLLFGVTNNPMIYMVSAITIIIIIWLYFIIYRLTSRTYYNIIER
ncbi:FtsX-like permease family protein [Streptococcus porcinus]|uniref:Transporter permease n=2 Tax=Streptococcus porcinus TaxID=1340 RepID=A0A4V0H3H6_STRPO|nr:ABC transporter permease [Streptococcus porcinus]EGJ26634.1 efflux ABC transporter, permease protein [Streptococcus porcinus str. Jelinkova 176]SQG44178.1 transporter permease [Streptococcus porcinus]VTT43670.1 transporter permease [Streptococcus porcinus]VTT45054.1 transporter permease [Streptococcus porcinus]